MYAKKKLRRPFLGVETAGGIVSIYCLGRVEFAVLFRATQQCNALQTRYGNHSHSSGNPLIDTPEKRKEKINPIHPAHRLLTNHPITQNHHTIPYHTPSYHRTPPSSLFPHPISYITSQPPITKTKTKNRKKKQKGGQDQR